jgi:hypothetical protein
MPTYELRYTEYREQHVTAKVQADSEEEAWAALDDEGDGTVQDIKIEPGDVARRFGTDNSQATKLEPNQKHIARQLADTSIPFGVDLRQRPRATSYDYVDYDLYFIDENSTAHIVQFGLNLEEGLKELEVELQQVRREETTGKWTNGLGLDALSKADRMYAESMMRRTARYLDEQHSNLSITFNL